MEKTPRIIVISGLPASGKTSIASEISRRLTVPFVSRDGMKEVLFDHLDWKDREWSKKLGMASYSLLYYFIESLLRSNTSCVVESNFKPEFDNQKFWTLKEKYDFTVVQILCKADGAVLFERFKQRAESGERHPGHVDTSNYDEFKNALLSGRCDPLDMQGNVIEVNTTDFGKVDIDAILRKVNTA
jgi:predicted kinase